MRPIRIILRWQIVATIVLALLAGLPWGADGALSAGLGGMVNLVAGAAFAWMASRGTARTAGEALRSIFRAEALKVILILAGLTLVLRYYPGIVHAAFFASFVITVVIFAAAIAIRDTKENSAPGPAGKS